jgi:hypothetical protein
MAIIPNGRRLQQQQSSNWSFRTFSVGFFTGLVCFAVMTFYISDLSIQHTNTMTSTGSNMNFLDGMPQTTQQQKQQTTPIVTKKGSDQNDNALAGLSCDAYGGPSNDKAQEMVYWQDIPSDRYDWNMHQAFCSLFHLL